MDIKEIFGKNVKRTRKARGLSQEKFAELLGIGTSALSKIECGKSYPTQQTIEKIIDVLNVKPSLLFICDEDINIEEAYKDILCRIENLKNNKELFKLAYNFIIELTK